MSAGVDTTFLVELEIRESKRHEAALRCLQKILRENQPLAIAPQVLAEFLHVATDGDRFEKPLSMEIALAKADFWWNAREITQVLPTPDSMRLFSEWMTVHRLGRKRILDTMLAATYRASGITSIISTNARDFSVFECFEIIQP